jgi:oxygen-independent coproporphyrinogen-3 oxidase
LRERFAILPGAETAIEIDPRTFDPAMAPALAAMGCTRASLGVQEFDPLVQRAVNRVQPLATVRATVDSLRAAGIGSIAFDLMYGLPHQTVGTLLATCREAVALRPDRIALFGYAHVPWIAKNQRLLPAAALPGPAERFAQAEAAGGFLAAEGFLRIGLDHFARPGDPMAQALAEGRLRRTFQGYTVDDADALLGFGATAIGRLPQGYVQNLPETRSWSAAVDAGRLPVHRGLAFTPEDRLRGRIIERLMCELAVDPVAEARAAGLAGLAFDGEFAALGPLVRDGLCRVVGTRIAVPPAARAALRIVAAVFDATLGPAGNGAGAGPRHAVAV